MLAYQDPPGLTPRETVVGVVSAVVPIAILVMTWWKTARSEGRKDTIAEYRSLYETQTASLAVSDAKVGKLTDQLTAKTLECGDLRAEAKYLREELEQVRAELARAPHQAGEG
jgi:hypothetical protein